jgi:hypothetical protein
MRSAIALSTAALAVTSAIVAAPAQATAAPKTSEHLKLKLAASTSPIGLTDIGIEAQQLVPYITAFGTLSGCVSGPAGVDRYAESATVVQDGVKLVEYQHSSGSGLVSCGDSAGTRVGSWPEIAWPSDTAPAIHPGRVKVTMTIYSYLTGASVTATRWATIPG